MTKHNTAEAAQRVADHFRLISSHATFDETVARDLAEVFQYLSDRIREEADSDEGFVRQSPPLPDAQGA